MIAMIKELIQKKSDEKKQKCNRLKWEIAMLQAKIDRAKRDRNGCK